MARVTTRRAFLTGVAALGLARAARADVDPTKAADFLASRTPADLTVLDLDVEGDKKIATRFLLYVPNHLAKDERVPLLVLFHGLGETWNVEIGVNSWVERYGLGTAYARLRRPPIAHTSRALNLLPDARINELNTALAARPFKGMAIACPFTPNVAKLPDGALDTYATWIADVVVPRCRKESPAILADRDHTAIDGVSLGGLVGIEVFTRRPDVFGVWGGIQSAFNAARIPHYVDRLAAAFAKAPAGSRPSVHITTSDNDPFRETNQALAAALQKKGVAHELTLLSGLHDQVFLRERGSLEMLLWHDRRMR
jgi:predicted esterase